MPTAYENRLRNVDAQAEKFLGDTILYTPAGGTAVTITGFIRSTEDEHEFASHMPGKHRWRCKIATDKLAQKPVPSDRIEQTPGPLAKLIGKYRPSADLLVDDGRYWSFDLERAL